jgi:hypothetical protein
VATSTTLTSLSKKAWPSSLSRGTRVFFTSFVKQGPFHFPFGEFFNIYFALIFEK